MWYLRLILPLPAQDTTQNPTNDRTSDGADDVTSDRTGDGTGDGTDGDGMRMNVRQSPENVTATPEYAKRAKDKEVTKRLNANGDEIPIQKIFLDENNSFEFNCVVKAVERSTLLAWVIYFTYWSN